MAEHLEHGILRFENEEWRKSKSNYDVFRQLKAKTEFVVKTSPIRAAQIRVRSHTMQGQKLWTNDKLQYRF